MKVLTGNYVTAITEKTKTLNNHNIARLWELLPIPMAI